MQTAVPLVVFSDLDGTLLDHQTYSWTPARAALQRLAGIGAPVVLASSKTAAEIATLQGEMGLAAYPAIVENGAGVIGVGTAAPGETGAYAALLSVLDQIPKSLRASFTGFGDMSAEKVAKVTGLSIRAAERARMRQFSEPGLWSGDAAAEAAFMQALGEHAVSARKGGRFLTLSFGQTKADRMREIIDIYRPAHVVALGDAPNDIEMLECADIGVIVANPHHTPLPRLDGETDGHIIRTEMAGPRGWNAAMIGILDRLGLKSGDAADG